MPPWLASLAQMRWRPERARRTGKVSWPPTRVVSAGSRAKASEEPSATWSVTLFTRFQYGSTARTVRLNAMPARWPVGVPLFPTEVPPSADSPGSKT